MFGCLLLNRNIKAEQIEIKFYRDRICLQVQKF